MIAQGNSYLSNNININKDRYINLKGESTNKRLGDRTAFSHTVDGKRYYSSLDAEIYFGESYIDEVIQITWGVEQATMPLFGYNSYTFDDIAIGARQISGSFIINFTKSGFLYDVLKSVQAVNRSSLNVSEALNDSKDLTWTSHFDKEHKASWNRSFNIKVGYGDHNKGGKDTTMIVLYCVQITGCQQAIGIDGAPIAEVYSFIAKDIRYEMNTLPETDSKEETDNSSSENTTTPSIKVFSHKLTATDSETYPYIVTGKYSEDLCVVEKIVVTIKDSKGSYINPSGVEATLEDSKTFKIKIKKDCKSKIEASRDEQKKLGVDKWYLLCDFKITYKSENGTKYIKIQNGEKVYFEE